jgi:hypothetical protein
MAVIPDNEPESARAGDTWKWTRTFADYPADTWTLTYRFKNAAGGFEIVAGVSGTTHSVNVAAATTSAYAAGSYSWIAWVAGGSSEKYTVDNGTLQVLPEYRTGLSTAALDDRSHAKTMLDRIEAWLETKDPAVAEYEIAGRRMKYIPIIELVKLRDRYRGEVSREADAARLAAGLPSRNKLLVRFNGNR